MNRLITVQQTAHVGDRCSECSRTFDAESLELQINLHRTDKEPHEVIGVGWICRKCIKKLAEKSS